MDPVVSKPENSPTSTGLSKDELSALVEEIHFIQKIMSDAEAVYASWEGWMVAAQGLLAAGAMQVVASSKFPFIGVLIAVLGLLLSVIFLSIQRGNHLYATARFNRWQALEESVSHTYTSGVTYMAILSSQRAELDSKKSKSNKWYESCWELPTTWGARKRVPLIFALFWIILGCTFFWELAT